MRDLDKRGILANDFLVVYGDVVSNISIESALNEHRARRAKDKNAIMTMVLREGNKDTHRGVGVSPVFTLDPARKRCLQYDQIRDTDKGGDRTHGVLLDEDVLLLSGAEEIDVRHDLIDCGIDICTPDVLMLWSDNFDYEAPRRGFLHSVLKDYELNGKTIHTFIEKEGYGNRVRDLRGYDRISRDVLSRRTWPICPDGAFGAESNCRLYKGNIFRDEEVKIAKSATIGKKTALGRGSVIGARTRVEGSVIGRNCTIGDDCVITGAYLWDNITIHDGTHIGKAIIASDSTVGKGCSIEDGTLVSFGTHVPEKTATKQRQRLVRSTKDSTPVDFNSGPDADSDIDDSASLLPQQMRRTASASSISTLSSSRSASPEPTHHRTTSSNSVTSINSDPSAPRGGGSESSFHTEAVASIYDSLLRGDDPANINLELQAQRLALNASEHAVRKAVVSALVSYVVHVREEQKAGKGQGKGTSVREILKHNGDLVRRVVFDLDSDDKPDQVDLLLLMQRELAGKKEGEVVMLSLCNGLYAEDLVQGEALVQWWEDKRGVETEGLKGARSHKQMEQLIDIAREEDESDEDEDEDEDDDSE